MSDLTIIIPTWNGRRLLAGCLTSLRVQTAACDVLVVDNGSRDSTEEIIRGEQKRFPGCLNYLRLDRNLGFAGAVNRGIAATQTPFVALLNNDTETDPRWVEAGLRAFQEFSNYSFFASRIVNFHHRRLLDSAGDCYNRAGIPYKRGFAAEIRQFRRPEPVPGASAAAAFYRRRTFDQVGLFDEGFFMYLEDVDWSLRAQLAGHRCLYLPDAIVYHMEAASDPAGPPTPLPGIPSSTSPHRSPTRIYWITRNRWQLMITYQLPRNWPWLLSGWLRSTLSCLLRGGEFRSYLRGLGAGMHLTRKAFRKRRVLKGESPDWATRMKALLKQC